ncbi:hypothetical protein [Bacillus phage phiAGATE]|uniref:Uncharacterized protein n=1 Tax=Bacillus phage phiAGATE TaxID=1204533 RepID=L0LBU3_9CAUD|nr:hypothetical protein G380_gp208 [Bacillus phage phiAGATE]AGB62615.1 hypothetical protein [Bacillus phage phiAGATE]
MTYKFNKGSLTEYVEMYSCPHVLYRFRGTEENPFSETTNHWANNPSNDILEVTDDHKVFETTLPNTLTVRNRTVSVYTLPDNNQQALVNHYYLLKDGEIVEKMDVQLLRR